MQAPAKKVLIIEDDEPIMRALSDKLAHAGYQVLQSGNGKEGLDAARTHHPDLILLDIIMPVMDGVDMLKSLREDPWGASAKVVIVSNLSDTQRVQECKDCGVDEYLIKAEWNVDQLVEKIGKVVEAA